MSTEQNGHIFPVLIEYDYKYIRVARTSDSESIRIRHLDHQITNVNLQGLQKCPAVVECIQRFTATICLGHNHHDLQ